MEEKQAKTNHKIILNMRKICQITGVIDVISFDENEVLLEKIVEVAYERGNIMGDAFFAGFPMPRPSFAMFL